jgi:hypothetical protein
MPFLRMASKFHARMILAVAEMVCPEAAAGIEEAIRLSARYTNTP